MEPKLGKNQYLLTSDSCFCECCNSCKIEDYNLYLGDSCEFFNYKSTIFVIGYAIDVDNPQYSIDEMCEQLLCRLNNHVMGPIATRSWNGRFVIVAKINNLIYIWHDCCGLKQLFYSFLDNHIIISSQARYIAQLCGYNADKDALEYMNEYKNIDKEYCWPVNYTKYREVKRLLPNHYLDLQKNEVFRMNLQFDNASVQSAANIIKNSINAASSIGKMAISLTAGLDSRLVLSSCSDTCEYDVVTFKYDWMNLDNNDILVARRICDLMRVNHQIVECKTPNKSFLTEYLLFTEDGHEYWAQMAEAVKKSDFDNCLWVKGSCNEILRNSYGYLYNWQVNSKVLCKLYGIPYNFYSRKAFDEWLINAKPFCKFNKIGVLDLFYWEHRMGSWLSECMNEFDYACESFTPFNSRRYIESLYAAKRKLRNPPHYKLFMDIIRFNNVDLLSVPINKGRYSSFKSFIKLYIKEYVPLIYCCFLNIS